MFFLETVKQDLWQMALELDYQPATFSTRQSIAGNTAATDDGADTTTDYSLFRVTYTDDLTSAELNVQATIADVTRLFVIYQADLDQAGAPQPVPLQTLAFARDGTTWVIVRVWGTAMNQAWRCLCYKAH